MRSVHSVDRKHLAFSDGFGLTRLSVPGGVKTERKIAAGLDAALSANPARTELLAWRQSWSSMHHLALPSLKALTKFERFRLAPSSLTPAGDFARVGARWDGRRHVATLERWTDPAAQAGSIDLDDGPALDGVALDGASGRGWARLATAPAGVWAVLQGEGPTLSVGDSSGPAGRVRWRAPVGLPRGAFVTLHPFDDGRVSLAAFVPARRESVVVRFAADGRVEGIHALATLTPAVPVAPDWALHQPDEGTVARTPLDGGVCRTTGLARDDQGVGRLFGEGASGWLLPWHAESLLDLGTADAVPRKLSGADAPLRRFFRERVARINAIANPAGLLVELCHLDVNPARSDYGFSWDATPGDGSLRGVLAAGTVNALTDDDALRSVHGWRWAVGGGIGVEVDAGRWDEGEVDDAFGGMESAGVPLLEALQCMDRAYEFRHDAPAPTRLPFARGGARRFLAGLVWSITGRGAEGLRAGARELSGELTAARVAEAVRALPAERGPRVGYHALDTLCGVAADALRGDVVPVIAAASRASDAWQSGVGAQLEPALRWLASEAPDRGAFAEALRRDVDPGSRLAFYLTRALG